MIKGALSDLAKAISEKSREIFEIIMPPVDIYEEGNNLIVIADLAGFNKEEIKLSLEENVLTIAAERKEKEGIDYLWKQRPLKIKKRILLPESVDTEKGATAKYENGVLTITLTLKEKTQIQIQ